MSTALQNRQQGERLEQLDPPSLPQTPIQPKRALIVSVGTGFGLLLGLGLAGLREIAPGRSRSVKDVSAYSQIPVLGSIPLFEGARRGAAAQASGLAGMVGRQLGGYRDHVCFGCALLHRRL